MAGAVQPCRPVPGALYPSGTEIVFPRIWEYRLAFGVVIEWTSFSFRCRSPSGGEVQNRGPQAPWSGRFKGAWGETGKTPPVADEASLFRGSGAIGGPEGAGNRNAATVLKSKSPRADDIRPYGIMEERQH